MVSTATHVKVTTAAAAGPDRIDRTRPVHFSFDCWGRCEEGVGVGVGLRMPTNQSINFSTPPLHLSTLAFGKPHF